MTSDLSSVRQLARGLLQRAPHRVQRRFRRLRDRLAPQPAVSIGVHEGDSPWNLRPAAWSPGPVVTAASVTDARAAFVADPFAVRLGDVWFLFFEVLNRGSGKGEIACSRSADLGSWEYLGRVLVEPFHLSYPHVFAAGGDWFMTPESWECGQVRLYRADAFPRRWVLDTVLLEGVTAIDPTPFRAAGRWWLLCESDPRHRYDTLRLYSSVDLRGPWTEHEASPLVRGDASRARPGGRVIEVGGVRYRMAQDCSRHYGEAVNAFPLMIPPPPGVSDVSQPIPVAGPGRQGWNGRGMHHVDAHHLGDQRWMAFVDGEA